MSRLPGRALLVAALSVALRAGAGAAQSLSSASNASPAVPAPTEAEYDAATPKPTGQTTTTYVVATTCTGSGSTNCRLFVSLGSNPQGFPLDIQWQMVSKTGGSTCLPQFTLGTWQDITASAIFTSNKNDSCTITFLFRVKNLSYSVHQAPGRNGTANPYQQGVTLTQTRP